MKPALITLILFLAVLLRGWGLSYDLPFIYHPDEPTNIKISQNIFRTGDLNPHYFTYPSLLFYINALACVPYYLFGKLMGIFHHPDDILPPITLVMGVAKAQTPTSVLLGRIIAVCFGVATVGLAYLSGKRITDKTAVGLLASLMVAISPTTVWNSRFVTPDIFMTFFALASFLGSVLIYQQGKIWQYVLAGACAGLAISSKYNGALIVFPLVAAHFLRYGKAAFKQPKLCLALLFCVLTFLATTPYAILDSSKFLKALRFQAHHYSTGHAGMEGNTLEWYLNYMWTTAGSLYLLGLLGILYVSILHPKEIGLLATFPIVYFVFISHFVVRNHRTFLPLTPFLFLLAAWFLVVVFDKIMKSENPSLRMLFLTVFAGLFIAAIMFPVSVTIADTRRLTTVNSRETARVWINKNLPPGAKIAVESYSPFVDTERFYVQGIRAMIEQRPEWYVRKKFGYLVFSEGMYERFYREPERYGAAILQYNNFFNQFTLMKKFVDGNYEIRVYKVQ